MSVIILNRKHLRLFTIWKNFTLNHQKKKKQI